MTDDGQVGIFLTMIDATLEFEGVITPLHEDLQYYAEMLDRNGGQFWRRGFVRALFAFVEGTIYRMKQIALASRFQPGVVFSLAEQALLGDETYELDDKGSASVKAARIVLLKNIRFAFKAFAKSHMAAYELNIGGDGWDAFKKSIKIRARLMHPKQAADLTVSDDENQLLLSAFVWFENSIKEVQSVSVQALQDCLPDGLSSYSQ